MKDEGGRLTQEEFLFISDISSFNLETEGQLWELTKTKFEKWTP
jgi:hypothetical protein